MKFGEYINANVVPEWAESYMDYNKLKKMINQLEETKSSVNDSGGKGCNSVYLLQNYRFINILF
jgi:SPX domain protein involved in polyphosphate accumulation